jgi:hypothetical protein
MAAGIYSFLTPPTHPKIEMRPKRAGAYRFLSDLMVHPVESRREVVTAARRFNAGLGSSAIGALEGRLIR